MIDKKSLERISFNVNVKDLAHHKAAVDYLQENGILNLDNEKYLEVMEKIDAIGKLKLDGHIYAFHTDDAWTRQVGYRDYETGEGVCLYLRQGNTVKKCVDSDRDEPAQIESAINFLKKNEQYTSIYTGKISGSEFLGIPFMCDEEDPLYHMPLEEDEIEEFRSAGIKVVELETLI